MTDIFLSHERTDRQRVAPIVAMLEACGWSVWWDQSAGSAQEPAEPEDKGSARELAAAGCVVAAWSVDAVESRRVQSEAREGLRRGILVSLQIDISTPPVRSGQAPSIGLAGWDGDAGSSRAQELIGAVGRVLGRDVVPAEAAVAPVVLLDEEDDDAAGVIPIEDDDEDFELPRALLAEREQRPHWERIQDSDDPNALWAFVVAYPTGRYAEAAWERLQRLGLAPPPRAPARFGLSLAVGLAIGLAAVVPAALWMSGWIGGLRPLPAAEDTVVNVERSPRPVAVNAVPAPQSPRPLRIEDLLAQSTPQVELLLAQARGLIMAGDICGARAVLQVSETARSGSLSFIMAETYDPNVLSAAHRRVADPAQARAFYLRARELGYGRAQRRLEALQEAGDEAGLPPRLISSCAPVKAAG